MNIAQYLISIGLKFDITQAPRAQFTLELEDAAPSGPTHILQSLSLKGAVPVAESDDWFVRTLLDNASAIRPGPMQAMLALADLTYFGPYVRIKSDNAPFVDYESPHIIGMVSTPALVRSELLVQVTADVVRVVVMSDGKVVPQVRQGNKGHTGIAIIRRPST